MKDKLALCQRGITVQRRKIAKLDSSAKRLKVQELSLIQDQGTSQHVGEKAILQNNRELILAEEDLWWKQWAKQHWLRFGDRNTKFYHFHANQRRRTNNISCILRANGRMLNDHSLIGDEFLNFYHDLFTSINHFMIDPCLNSLDTCISNDINNSLVAKFTEGGVREALFHMNPLEALGPNGYFACFYQHNCHIMGKDICRFVHHILNHRMNLYSINHTFITLIPKIKNLLKVEDFIPISLCNIIYKIIAKVLANRLKRILHQIILPS